MEPFYCFIPDQEKFHTFLKEQGFSTLETLQLATFNVQKICVNKEGTVWQLHYQCRTGLSDQLIQAVVDKLTTAFSIKRLELIDVDGRQTAKVRPASTAVQEDVPLPPEPADYEELPPPPEDCAQECELEQQESVENELNQLNAADYEAAYHNLYHDPKEDGVLYGRMPKGKVKALRDLVEEENKVVVEGTIVPSLDKDSEAQPYIERELKTGDIIFSFNIADDEGGLTISMRFRNRTEYGKRGEAGAEEESGKAAAECKAFKANIKLGRRIRIQGDVAPDKYNFDEMTMSRVTGMMKLPDPPERLDNCEEKRVELHCHTKMSKLDGLTPMKDLVRKAIKWGHKALAITDHGVVQAFPFCYDEVEEQGSDLKLIFGMEGYLIADRADGLKETESGEDAGDTTVKTKNKVKSYHIIILAKNETGLRNLYKLVSISHLQHMVRRPLLPRKIIEEFREGLILGSACEAGELYRAVLAGADDKTLEEIASFYDYLEIQPLGNNDFLVREERCTREELKEHNRRIVELGKRLGKPVCATCDVHFLNPEDAKLRSILQAAQHYKDADQQPPLYYRTTEEMLSEFAYLGEETAYEVCVTNTNKIAAMVKKIKPVPDRDQLYSPFIPGAEQYITDYCYNRAHSWYGDVLPEVVKERLEYELGKIIQNGFAVLYYIAHKLVKHSLDRGYLVGSRGSVGSSFVATMLEITEVNPLQPHYRCPKCRRSQFFLKNEVDSGFDLPAKDCPDCGVRMLRDGHEIPFAVFLGFNADKVPDIDLNFSGGVDPDDPDSLSDQSVAHAYTEELFGRDNVCRAGTIATVANKTAIGFIKKYYEERNIHAHPAMIAKLMEGLAGVKRTTGQHPGGIMVVPRNMDIHYITPMNHPADKNGDEEQTITTHYDYHSINDRLVKLDILGHDDPMVLKMLEKYLQETFSPDFNPRDIPVGDEATMRLFQDTSSLGVTPEQINSEVGTFGIPECGTNFVRQMIKDVQPKNFSEIVRVSGYSHGTDVWLNNAQDLIREGKAVKDTISTRDDIMTNLIAKGVDPSIAFKTMEYCRKGKAAKNGLEPKMREAMVAAGIPDWYMKSCQTVKYLFPKAHAVAYVLMAYRIAYCKVHHPKEFYAAYFTVRATDFDYANVYKGKQYIKDFMRNVALQGFKASNTDKDAVTYLELANEMLERGYEFEKMDLYESDALKFKVTEKGLRPPLSSLSGVGSIAALAIAKARKKGGPFLSQEDLRMRAGIGKSVTERLASFGVLGDLPESNQGSLFDMI